MKKNLFPRLTASLLFFTLIALPVAGAEEPKPIPSVAQVSPVPENPLPLTKPGIPDKPSLPFSEPLPESSLGLNQNSLEFLKENPGITTGNLKDLIPDGVTPLVIEKPEINPPDSPLNQEESPVDSPPSLLTPPSLPTQEITVDPVEEPVFQPIKEAPAPEEKSSFPGLGGNVLHLEVVKRDPKRLSLEAALDGIRVESASAAILNRPLRQADFEKILEHSIREGIRITVIVLYGRTILLTPGSGDEMRASQARAMRRILEKAVFVFQGIHRQVRQSRLVSIYGRYLEALKTSKETLDSQQARRRARVKLDRLIERFLGSDKE